MKIDLNMRDGLVPYQLISDATDDIVIETDREGFIRYASASVEKLGFSSSDMLIWPHVRDLVDEPFKAVVSDAFNDALQGCRSHDWLEFRSPMAGAPDQWFAVRFTALRDDQEAINGALGIVRNLRATKQIEERLFRAELTDPLTGLTNRQAWMDMLKHMIAGSSPGCMALIDIDYFKAINFHYGVSSGDEFLIAFADFLRSQTPAPISISRIGASRFAVLLPDWSISRAESLCREIVHALADLHCTDWYNRFSVTASIGIVGVATDLDSTVKAAETALRLARAKGGNTVITDQNVDALRIS